MSTEGYFMTVESTNTRPASGISRRRLVQGAAWATPAVILATAAPAAAASNDPVSIAVAATSTDLGGNKHRVSFTVTRVETSPYDSTVPLTNVKAKIFIGRHNTQFSYVVPAGWTNASYSTADGVLTMDLVGSLTSTTESATAQVTFDKAVAPTKVEVSGMGPTLVGAADINLAA